MQRFTRFTTVLVLVAALGAEAPAQRGSSAPAYKVGQKVWAEWKLDWKEARIVKVGPGPMLQVQLAGREHPVPVFAGDVRPISEKGEGAKKPSSGMGFGDLPDDFFDDMDDDFFGDMGDDFFGDMGDMFGDMDGKPYKPGERVEVRRANWEPAVVVGQQHPGVVEVRILKSGVRMTVPTMHIRRVARLSPERQAELEPPTMRTWTDITGKFKVEAKFVKREADQVTIERAGGEQVSLPLAKLSQIDQDYVRERTDGVSEPGFAGMGSFGSSTTRSLELTDPGKTSVAPDGVADLKSLTKRPILVRADSKSGPMDMQSMAETKAVVIHRPSARAFASTCDMDLPGQALCFDLKRGKVLWTFELPKETYVADVSPSGKQMLVQFGGFSMGAGPGMGGEREQVYLWDLDGGPTKQTAAWQPYSGMVSEIEMAGFLDDDHVVTSGGEQTMVVWETAQRKAVYSVRLLQGSLPAVSPGRKQIALASQEGIFVLDSITGTPLAKLPGDPTYGIRFGFRSDGRQLAAADGMRLQVWDLEKGTRIRDIRFPGWSTPGSPTWVGPEHILLKGTDLVDIERRVVLWRYQWPMSPPAGATVGGLYWTLMSDIMMGQRALVAVKLPHLAAEQVAKSLTPESLLAVKPGIEVSVDVNVSLSPEERQTIHDTLVRRLEENGIRVVEGSKVVLKAATGQGETVDVTYRGGARGGGGEAQITQRISTLTMTEGGNVLWQAKQLKGAPVLVRRKRDESLDSAIAKQLKPTTEFFVNAPIPRYLARPGKDGTYGKSQISMAGIRTIDN